MTLTITLPLPPRALSPNGRPHHFEKAREAKKRRNLAMVLTLAALPAGWKPRFPSASVEIVRYSKVRRRRDSDNLISSEKNSIDGVVDSGFLADDDQITHLPPRKLIDRQNPRIEIHITPTK